MEQYDVNVYTKNASYLEIIAERNILMELHDIFSFLVDGHKHMPKFQAGMWDGRIHLFSLNDQTIYAGLFDKIVEWAEDFGYTLGDHQEGNFSPIDNQYLDEWFSQLDPHSEGNPIAFRDYQKDTVGLITENERLTILSPTSSGKSLSIYSSIRYFLDHKPGMNILLVVPKVGLVKQMFSDFQDYSTENCWDTEENCHMIGGKKLNIKETDKKVTISTWQSIYKMPLSYFSKFNVVLVDEVHGASASSLTGILTKCHNAYYRYGFTGTLSEAKTDEMVITGLFGRVEKVLSTREMIDKGYASKIQIKALVLKYQNTPTGKMTYPEEMEMISTFYGRNVFISHLVTNHAVGSSLVLFQYVEKHGKPLYEMIKKKAKHPERVFYIDGNVPAEEREMIRNKMEVLEDAVLVASYGTVGTGTNIKSLHNVFFTSPSKSKIRVLQAVGRGLRLAKGKDMLNLYDIVDNFYPTLKKNNYTFKHFLKRLEFYRNDGFPVKFSEIDIVYKG